MPVTRKEKRKARGFREADMISDLENRDVMIGSDHNERKEDSEYGNSVRSPESPSYDALIDHNSKSHSNSRDNEIRDFTSNGQNNAEIDSGSYFNRLSVVLNRRITQEMNGLMNSVSLLIQRAVNAAINEQVLRQLQASLRTTTPRRMELSG